MSENEKIDTSNIFEDFENDKSLREEINSIENKVNKDSIYYISIVWNIFKYINFTLFIVMAVLWSYIFVQASEKENFYEKAFLDPFCGVLLGDNRDIMDESYCSWVWIITKKYEQKIEKQKEDTMYSLAPVLKETYEVNDFLNSRKVSFVLDKTKTRFNPLDILSKFDEVKNKFLSVDKTQIECYDIKIESNELEANCYAFSSFWDGEIPWFEGEKGTQKTLWGTSISIASSFLNFIEKYRDADTDQKVFLLEDKQKVFTSETLTWEDGYIYKTNFKVKLLYRDVNLSL